MDKTLFDAWWTEQTGLGDPSRRSNLVEDAYWAGYKAATDGLHPALWEFSGVLNDLESEASSLRQQLRIAEGMEPR